MYGLAHKLKPDEDAVIPFKNELKIDKLHIFAYDGLS